MKLSPWKIYTDTAEHFKIHQIIHGISTKVYTKNEAKAKLQNVDLSDLETFRPNIKEIIEDVLKEEPVVKEVVEVAETPPVSRKRNYKVNKVETNERAKVEAEVAAETE